MTFSGGHLAPALDGFRLSLHVLAAAMWVGGQLTLAGLVPAARGVAQEAPRALARAFARIQWPAYAVLLATGFWNVGAAGTDHTQAWRVVLGVKIGVALLAGVAALSHTRSRGRAGMAAWGALSALSSVAALVLGVFLAG